MPYGKANFKLLLGITMEGIKTNAKEKFVCEENNSQENTINSPNNTEKLHIKIPTCLPEQ